MVDQLQPADVSDINVFHERLVEEALAVCRIPAPTFAEGERAAYISRRLKGCGLQHVETDALHNVSAILTGAGGGPTIMVVAHMDTVFPADTDVEPRSDGRYWRAPGIRDNSASVAVVLLLPEMLRHRGLHLAGDLILAFSVGEEGRGDLRGIKALMDRYGSRVSAVVAADGNLGVINHIGISVRRLELVVTTEGGHSWADAGKPSAVHILTRIASDITRLPVPESPRSALNIGTFNGGTSVNAIAQSASLALDLRSVDAAAVARLEEQVREIADASARADGVGIAIEVIGDRPGGQIPENHPLVEGIVAGYKEAQVPAKLLAGSTDANIPLSLGIPAASMGVSAGGGIHTLNEYLDPDTLPLGAAALLSTLAILQRKLPQ